MFGAKTSKPLVRWTFGGLLLLCGVIGSALEPPKTVDSSNETAAPQSVGNMPRNASHPATQQTKVPEVGIREQQVTQQRIEAAEARAKAAEQRAAKAEAAMQTKTGKKKQSEPTSANLDIPKKDFFGFIPINPGVKYDHGSQSIVVKNGDKFVYENVKLSINGQLTGYFYKIPVLRPGEEQSVYLYDFAKPKGTRFDLGLKITEFNLVCETPYGHGAGNYNGIVEFPV